MTTERTKLNKSIKFSKRVLSEVFGLHFIIRFKLFRACAKLSELNAKNMNKMAMFSLVKLSAVFAVHSINFLHLYIIAERGFYLKMLLNIQRRLSGKVTLKTLISEPKIIIENITTPLAPHLTEILNMLIITGSLVVAATIVAIALKRDEIHEKTLLLKSDLVEYGIQQEVREGEEEKKEKARQRALHCLWTPDGVLIESRKSTEKSIREMETFWNSINRTPGAGVQDSVNRHLYFFPFGFVLQEEYPYDYAAERTKLRKS